jgi:hypothetical protein
VSAIESEGAEIPLAEPAMFRFDLTNKLGARPTRIGLDKQMHVIRRYFAWTFIASNVAASPTIQRSPLDAICHHRTTVVRTPNHVIRAENSHGILGVSRYLCRFYNPGTYNRREDGTSAIGLRRQSPRQELDAQGGRAVVR